MIQHSLALYTRHSFIVVQLRFFGPYSIITSLLIL